MRAATSLWFGHPFALRAPVFELAATGMLYPLISFGLVKVHNLIPRVIHAP